MPLKDKEKFLNITIIAFNTFKKITNHLLWTRSEVGRGVHWEYSRVKSSLNQSQKNCIGLSWLFSRIPSSCYRKIEFIFEAASIPDDSDGRESACNTGDSSIIPGSGRSPREWNGYPLQYSCLENSMDKGAWQAAIYGFTKSQTQLSN